MIGFKTTCTLLLMASCLCVSCNEEDESYSCVDKMGKSYKTVVIGNQVWMAENLTNTVLSKDDKLPNYIESRNYPYRNFPQFAYYDDNSYYYNYGLIYNYEAVIDERLIPKGWRLPTQADWEELTAYIRAHPSYESPDWVAKALASKYDWTASNVLGAIGYQRNTNNKYGFNVKPTGFRSELGAYYYEDRRSYFWTATVDAATTNRYVAVFTYDSKDIQFETMDKIKGGCYIRCVRDR